MGGTQSAPAPPPPKIIEDPYPQTAGAEGISLSQAVKCTDCQLEVDTNISVASVKLKRELGDIQSSQCAAFAADKQKVESRFMSLSDLLSNLQAGKYSRPVSEQNVTLPGGGQRVQGYCEMLSISDEDAAKVTTIAELESKLKGGRIRQVSGSGGFSSGTKARYIPSIPFKMSFAGTKAVAAPGGERKFAPFKSDFTVSQLVIYHPSPIRVDSVQADAMLALNDPSDSGATAIVLIPLKGTNSSEGAASFINKLAASIPSVSQYDSQTGSYLDSTVQTGADWTLGRLFTLDKEAGKGGVASVKNGFFTWTGVAGYERYKIDSNEEMQKAFASRNWGRVNELMAGGRSIRYAWRPIDGLASPQYFLLDSPLEVNLTDLSMITSSLTPTPPAEANHLVPAERDLVFHKGSVPPAPDTISGAGACGGVLNVCEGFTTGTLDEQLKEPDEFEKGCPGAKCDPFLQNVKEMKSGTFTTTALFTAFFNVLVFVAMAVGAYIALNMVGNDYDIGLRNFAESIGKILAVWAKGVRNRLPSLPSMRSAAPAAAMPAPGEVPAMPAMPGIASKLSGLLKRKA